MDEKEKLLLIQLILEDIRGNWADELESRTNLALRLAEELNLQRHVESISEFQKTMNSYYCDGRYFRTNYEYGGYEGMSTLHGLEHKLEGRSEEFKKLDLDTLTYPEHRFEDYE